MPWSRALSSSSSLCPPFPRLLLFYQPLFSSLLLFLPCPLSCLPPPPSSFAPTLTSFTACAARERTARANSSSSSSSQLNGSQRPWQRQRGSLVCQGC
eukprot:3548806-Rhodomonas_salina.1